MSYFRNPVIQTVAIVGAIAGFVELGTFVWNQFGWKGLAFAAGVLVVVPAGLAKFLDFLNAKNEAVTKALSHAAASGMSEALASLESMREELEWIKRERDEQRALMDRLTRRLPGKFIEGAEFRYDLSQGDEPDRFETWYTTTAMGHSLLWRRFERMADIGISQSFDGTDFELLRGPDGPSASYMRLQDNSRTLVGLAIFTQEIEPGQSVKWGFRGERLGMWDPLRKRGEDWFTYKQPEGAEVSEMSLTVVFPKGSTGAELECDSPRSLLKEGTQPDGRPVLTLSVRSPFATRVSRELSVCLRIQI